VWGKKNYPEMAFYCCCTPEGKPVESKREGTGRAEEELSVQTLASSDRKRQKLGCTRPELKALGRRRRKKETQGIEERQGLDRSARTVS